MSRIKDLVIKLMSISTALLLVACGDNDLNSSFSKDSDINNNRENCNTQKDASLKKFIKDSDDEALLKKLSQSGCLDIQPAKESTICIRPPS